jgi:hypothetical protein
LATRIIRAALAAYGDTLVFRIALGVCLAGFDVVAAFAVVTAHCGLRAIVVLFASVRLVFTTPAGLGGSDIFARLTRWAARDTDVVEGAIVLRQTLVVAGTVSPTTFAAPLARCLLDRLHFFGHRLFGVRCIRTIILPGLAIRSRWRRRVWRVP